MKKIAIFIEGESDMIFSSYLIKVIFGLDKIKIKYVNRRTEDEYDRSCKLEEGYGDEYEFTIFNFGNDVRVVNKLEEQAKRVHDTQYDSVIGLRDLGSQKYNEMAGGRIDAAITETMIDDIRGFFADFQNVNVYFSIMELEAWYLALTKCLEKAGYDLDNIGAKLGVVLADVDPEIAFYDPKKEIKKFEDGFREVDFAHKIGSKIEVSDIDAIKTGVKVAHFREYIEALEAYKL